VVLYSVFQLLIAANVGTSLILLTLVAEPIRLRLPGPQGVTSQKLAYFICAVCPQLHEADRIKKLTVAYSV
jgi:hypothetical protein